MTTQTFRRDHFTWLAYLLLAFYAFFVNILGPITPFLKDELKLSYTISSLHFTAFAVGILLVGLGGNTLVQHIGQWRSLWVGAFGMSLSAFLLIFGRTPVITISASLCMGLIGSLILVIVPLALSEQHGEHRAVALSEANVVASMVSAMAPLVVGWTSFLPGGWRFSLGIAAISPLILSIVFNRAKPSLSNPEQKLSPTPFSKPLPILYWVYWTAIVLAVSVEFCMIFWGADYLENTLGIPKVNAAQSVSLFLAGMIIGRLASSRLVYYISTYRVVIVSIITAGTGFLLFWSTNHPIIGLVGLFVTGLGVSSLYPLILSLAIATAKGNSVQASTRATLANGTAILLLPLILGRLADIVGIRMAYSVVAVLLVCTFTIMVITNKANPANQPIDPSLE